MSSFGTVDSLQVLTRDFITEHLPSFIHLVNENGRSTGRWAFGDAIFLPSSIADVMIKNISRKGLLTPEILSAFTEQVCRVKDVCINSSAWTANQKGSIFKGQKLSSLVVLDCKERDSLHMLRSMPVESMSYLESLSCVNRYSSLYDMESDSWEKPISYEEETHLSLLWNLRHLREVNLLGCASFTQPHLEILCHSSQSLEVLNLSRTGVWSIVPLMTLANKLKALQLADTKIVQLQFDDLRLDITLEEFQVLEILDLGMSQPINGSAPAWMEPFLNKLSNVEYLPHLTHLDIYGIEGNLPDWNQWFLTICNLRPLRLINLPFLCVDQRVQDDISKAYPLLQVSDLSKAAGVILLLERHKLNPMHLTQLLNWLRLQTEEDISFWESSLSCPKSNRLIEVLIDIVLLYEGHTDTSVFQEAVSAFCTVPKILGALNASHSWLHPFEKAVIFLVTKHCNDFDVCYPCLEVMSFLTLNLGFLTSPQKTISCFVKVVNANYQIALDTGPHSVPDMVKTIQFLDFAFAHLRVLTREFQYEPRTIPKDEMRNFVGYCVTALHKSVGLGAPQDGIVPRSVINCLSILKHIIAAGFPLEGDEVNRNLKKHLINLLQAVHEDESFECQIDGEENSYWKMVIKLAQLLGELERIEWFKGSMADEEMVSAIVAKIEKCHETNGSTFEIVWWCATFFLKCLTIRKEQFSDASLLSMRQLLGKLLGFENRRRLLWCGLERLILKYELENYAGLPVEKPAEYRCSEDEHEAGVPCVGALVLRFYLAYLYHADQRYMNDTLPFINNDEMRAGLKQKAKNITKDWPEAFAHDKDSEQYFYHLLTIQSREDFDTDSLCFLADRMDI